MIISGINSIRFVKQDAALRTFGNTLLQNEKFYNDEIFTYCQRFMTTDTAVKVQIKSDSATLPTAVLTKQDNTTVNLTVTQVSSYSGIYFFEFTVNMGSYLTESFITVTQGADVWRSEPFRGDATLLTELQDGEVVKIEYYNDDNAFQIDFTATDIAFVTYVEAILKDYEPGGESSIYDNQDEITKLKETVSRMFNFQSLYVPRYVAEQLRLASSCDYFTVNGVAYVREDIPEIEPVEGSNLVEVTMKLTDKEYIGVNTHDVGFDVDTPINEATIMIQSELNASGSVSFSVPAGYMVHTMRVEWVSGTTVAAKLGTTISGDELATDITINSVVTMMTIAIHSDLNRAAAATIYATISGGVANIDVQLIQNKE